MRLALLLALPALAAAFGAGRVAPVRAAAPAFASVRSAFARVSMTSTEAPVDAATDAPAASAKETFTFEAEVARVMDIIVNSLYSNKDIFLRELISNASDACDKKRFLGLTNEGASAGEGAPCIRVRADKKARTVTIEDMGVGMNREDLIKNLGTIAQSGTKKFLESLKVKPGESNMIGQFGVGFYSAFLVADKVSVVTKAVNGEQLRWESNDDKSGSYSIEQDASDPIEGSSGTRVVLTLKEDAEEYLDEYKLRSLLGTYSEFISFPVELWAEKTEYERVVDEEAAPASEGEPARMKTVPKTTATFERLNKAKPLWMRPPATITEDEYADFYKSAFKAWDNPIRLAHFSMEGQVEFKCLIFVPTTLPFELSQEMFAQADSGAVRLYVKRVFISDRFSAAVLPRWLSFLKVLIDSEDLPLNVSRELLQKSKVLSIVAKRVVRKSLDQLLDLSEDDANFGPFYEQFGKYIKVGLIEDRDNKDALLKLARFSSSRNAVALAKAKSVEAGSEAEVMEAGALTSLEAYVSRMPEGQKQVYYVAGTSKAALEGSPVLEALTAKGYEVLYALDSVDEIALQGIGEFKDLPVVDAAKQNADLGEESEEEKETNDQSQATLASTLTFLKETLGSKVDKVELSRRLRSSPAAIVQPQWGMSPQMERFMRAQAVAMGQSEELDGMPGGASTAILELNPTHPVVRQLDLLVKTQPGAEATREYAQLLYEVAAVTSGYEIADPAAFARRITALMATDGVAEAEPAEEAEMAVTPVEIMEGDE
mmetsp:Transcript_15683/g.39936  ORF Transcript_15683/g.39936 Transcript_15683/m.39936 type:complete len:770 (-) Transcript_15683:119-2428(-)